VTPTLNVAVCALAPLIVKLHLPAPIGVTVKAVPLAGEIVAISEQPLEVAVNEPL